ncbi:hypothetical protein N9F36_07685 [Akkermansiaceae bacterium]|nr:hypothetical protein [Akkermansiaceae bacterium]
MLRQYSGMNDPEDVFDDTDLQLNQGELHEELTDYNDSMAHCHSDGWFYHDDNDGDPPNSDYDDYN